jgi:hypothetical protein
LLAARSGSVGKNKERSVRSSQIQRTKLKTFQQGHREKEKAKERKKERKKEREREREREKTTIKRRHMLFKT